MIKFTYGGDATINGLINVDDYNQIDGGSSAHLTGWYNGDFNYDGAIGVDDYLIIDANVSTQGDPL